MRYLIKQNCSNSWTLFGKIKFIIISKHERYRTWKFIRWNTRFNRLTMFQLFEFTFPRMPDYNCHECCKLFQPKNKFLIQKGFFPIWECPHCSYPNDSHDLGMMIK